MEEQDIGGQRSDNQVDHSIRESCRKTHKSSEDTGPPDRQHKACQLQMQLLSTHPPLTFRLLQSYLNTNEFG